MIPSYLGLAHQAFTSFSCCSYSASSAAPALADSERSWKASEGRAVDIGESTADCVDNAIRLVAIECRIAGLNALTPLARRGIDRDMLRSIFWVLVSVDGFLEFFNTLYDSWCRRLDVCLALSENHKIGTKDLSSKAALASICSLGPVTSASAGKGLWRHAVITSVNLTYLAYLSFYLARYLSKPLSLHTIQITCCCICVFLRICSLTQ